MSVKDLNELQERERAAELAEFELFLREETVSEADVHSTLIRYLLNLLEWLYRVEGWYFNTDMGIYQPGLKPVSPDIALHRGLVLSQTERADLNSWRMDLPNRPAPTLVIEICSQSTWFNDVDLMGKPLRYKQMGVKEYYAYDANPNRLWTEPNRRLRGWRYTLPGTLAEQELQPSKDAPDRLSSLELGGWLKEDGTMLLILDQQGQTRLTGAEAGRIADQRANRERAASEALRVKLRAMGIDPDTL